MTGVTKFQMILLRLIVYLTLSDKLKFQKDSKSSFKIEEDESILKDSTRVQENIAYFISLSLFMLWTLISINGARGNIFFL